YSPFAPETTGMFSTGRAFGFGLMGLRPIFVKYSMKPARPVFALGLCWLKFSTWYLGASLYCPAYSTSRHQFMTMSCFFFYCAVIGAVCGLVAGLIDSADSSSVTPSKKRVIAQ